MSLPALNMVSLKPDRTRLMTLAVAGKTLPRSGDLGYAIHQMLTAVFGGATPQPFQLLDQHGFQILGYSVHDEAALLDYAALQKAQISNWENISTALNLSAMEVRTMPSSWKSGRQYRFSVRTRPVMRINHAKQRGLAKECDVFLRKIEAKVGNDNNEWLDRETVYLSWFRSQIAEDTARLAVLTVSAMKRTPVYRKGAPFIDGPDVTFTGVLEVADPIAFASLLARGIGRHRAFGFGMLLLAPVNSYVE